MRSIKLKFIFSTVSIIIIGLVLISTICYIVAKNIILNETIDKTENSVQTITVKIDNWLDAKKNLAKNAGKDAYIVQDFELIKKICVEQFNNNVDLASLNVGFEDDSAIFNDDWIPPVDWKPTERPWYTVGMSGKGDVRFTEPYVDSVSGSIAMSATVYIGKVKNLDTVFAVDFMLNTLTDIINNTYTEEGNYFFLVDSNNDIITHLEKKFAPTGEKGLVSMLNIDSYKNLPNLSQPVLITDYDGVARYIIKHKSSTIDWTVYAAIPESTILKPVNDLFLLLLLITLTIIIIAVIIIWYTVGRIVVKPILSLKGAATKLVDGDLNIQLKKFANDEIGDLRNDFVKVVGTLDKVITEMNNMSKIHSTGDFEYRIDTAQFNGAYQEVVSGVNNMTNMYVQNFTQILNFLSNIGNGNFNAKIMAFPGKLSICNKIIDDLIFNLKNVIAEINLVSDSAREGILSNRAKTDGFEGDWRNILWGLNGVIEAIVNPIQEASSVLQELAKGNLNVKMTGSYKGDFKLIEVSMNTTIDALASYITEISSVLSDISNNDLKTEISRTYLGDFEKIRQSINLIISTLNNVFTEINEATSFVRIGAQNVSQSSEVLSTGVSEQESYISNLTDNLNTIKEQTKLTLENSLSADELSAKSLENATVGNIEMDKMLKSMDDIKNSSNSIANIIKVIDDIAFQTSILALNAAVEAARAGVMGKGFAVVAEEVRSLAGRSQSAARETAVLITNTIEKINHGMQIAKTTSDALTKIVDNVNEVSGVVGSISDVSKKQSDSVDQVYDGIHHIADVVRNTSQISYNNSAQATELNAQVEILNNLLSVFMLK